MYNKMETKKCILFLGTLFQIVLSANISETGTEGQKEDFFSYFIREAPKHGADYESDYSPESIPWLERSLIEREVKSYDRNFIGINLATLYSGIELFAIKSTTSVLMISGTIANRTNAYKRVLRTALHMLNFCTAGMDIFRKGSPAYNSLESIRRHHRSASYIATNRTREAVEFMDKNTIEIIKSSKEVKYLVHALRKDLENVDTSEAPTHLLNSWDSTPPVSQFDLGVVQFIIFSHMVMRPEAFGIYQATPEDIRSYIHQSALMGRILGIQDRFNVALNLPQEMYKRFYRNIVVASLKNVEEPVIHAMMITMDGMSENFIVPSFLRLKCWLHRALLNGVEEYQGNHILKLMNYKDRSCLMLLGIGAGPLNLLEGYGNFGKSVFKNWFRDQKKKYNIEI